MLTVSPTASEAIKGLVASADLPDEGGVRIAAAPGTGMMELSLRDTPEDGDQVVRQGGASVFLEAELVSMLDDKLLDARVEGDQVGFAIVPASGNGAAADPS